MRGETIGNRPVPIPRQRAYNRAAPLAHVLVHPTTRTPQIMPRSARPQAYPLEYQQLLNAASLAVATPGGYYSLTLPSPSQAQALKSKLYAYFRAVRSDPASAALAAKSDLLSLSVADCVLIIRHQDDSWDAKLLREAMGLQPQSHAPMPMPGEKSILQALQDLRASK